MTHNRLVIVSNRLPIKLHHDASGWNVSPSTGGLVQALSPVLSHRGGLWIGWPGVVEEAGEGWREPALEATAEMGYELFPVPLSEAEIDGFYRGFANSVLWPLFHDLLDACDFNPAFWHTYRAVNEKYGEVVQESTEPDDVVWVHDYQLIHIGEVVRRLDPERRIGFFLHIPFPPLDIFLKLPWRADILRALLVYDVVGFQTSRDRWNFLTCVRKLMPEIEFKGRGALSRAHVDGREITVGNFPISIDFKDFATGARSSAVKKEIRKLRDDLRGRRLILGVDRLDYTKGQTHRFLAFENALERFPELREKVTFIQLTVPSREDVPEYEILRREIERLVGNINGRFGTPGWVPIRYLYRSVPRHRLLALYRFAEVAFVTPLKDGMNLVAKEYCACQTQKNGVLVLSEFAGAAAQLSRGALLVNPYDIEGMARTLRDALELDADERRARMRRMCDNVRRQDIHWWVERYLSAVAGRPLASFRGSKEYLPEIAVSAAED